MIEELKARLERNADTDSIGYCQIYGDRESRDIARLAYRQGRDSIRTEILLLVEALTGGINSIENTLALMAEGEGDDPQIYREMSKGALTKLRAALAKLGGKT